MYVDFQRGISTKEPFVLTMKINPQILLGFVKYKLFQIMLNLVYYFA